MFILNIEVSIVLQERRFYPLDFDFNIRLRARRSCRDFRETHTRRNYRNSVLKKYLVLRIRTFILKVMSGFFVARKRKIRWFGPLRFSTLFMLLSVFIVGTENKIYPKNIIILVITGAKFTNILNLCP